MTVEAPQFVLYAQHGWADDRRAIASLAQSLVNADTNSDVVVIAPSLGFFKTWIRIEPLIQTVEALAIETISRHPELPMRIVGHSMGGLIWLEVLARHPEWWSKVESLVLVGTPVGGADLARAIDPFGWGIGMARDLGTNRRQIAEAIALQIPTLTIAGDIDNGSDGTVPVQCTKVFGAEFVRLPGIHHAALKNHPAVAAAIQQFWAIAATEQQQEPAIDSSRAIIQRLQAVNGMTDGHERNFAQAQIVITLADGTTLRTWKNWMGIDHVFVACSQGQCLYGGFVGWFHAEEFHRTLDELKREHSVVFL